MAQAVAQGGMKLIEIAGNSDQAPQLVSDLRTALPTCQIGVGTILAVSQLREAIAAGAQFCFTPHVDLELIRLAQAQGVPIIAGALSPTEMVRAWQAGVSSVKIFPVQAMGGCNYIRSLQGPLSHIPLIPTGGVTLETARAYIAAGAIAVGLSSCLFPPAVVASGNWTRISQTATTLMTRLGQSGLGGETGIGNRDC